MMRFEMGASPEEQLMLEDWLDGELSEQTCTELRERLGRDPALSAELTRLQAERQVRSGFWQCCEPTSEQIDLIAHGVRRECLKHKLFQQRVHMLRNGAALAATFAVVFASGWMGRGRMMSPQGEPRVDNREVVAAPVLAPRTFANVSADYAMPPVNPWPVDGRGLSTRRPTFRVALIDPMGTTIDSQEFDDIRDARKIDKSFSDLQSRVQNAQRPDTAVVNELVAPH